MVNYSTNVLKDVWVAISDSKDYVLQNKGTGSILVKASDTMPTDTVGVIEVQGKKWITSKELYGKIWCSAAMEEQPIAYGIGGTTLEGVSDSISVEITNPTKELYLSGTVSTAVLQGKDFAVLERFAGGQQCLALSCSPLGVGTESLVVFNETFKPSFTAEYGVTLSQRVKGILPYLEIVDTDNYDETFTEFNIVSLSQTATTLTVTINNPFDGNLGYWVDIYGLADNRFNYANLCVNSISTDKKTLTFTYAEDIGLTSLTATPANVIGGKLKCQSLGANNFAQIRYSAISNGSTAFGSRFNQGTIKRSGTLVAAQTAWSGSTVAIYAGAKTGAVELKPSTRAKIMLDEDQVSFLDAICDGTGNGVSDSPRQMFTEVKPSYRKEYRSRMRLVTPVSTSRPVARITKAEKLTATTTATITIDIPCAEAGLVTGSYVTIKGIRDQTNFANTTIGTITVTGANTFTVTIGTAAIASSYGGAVILANGSQDQPGIITQTVQSITKDATSNIVEAIGSTNWSVLNIGEYINLYGCLGLTGNDLGVDGVYRINNINTYALRLEPVKNLDNTYVLDGEGNQVTPSITTMGPTNCGGAVILRTTMRMHDISTISYAKQMFDYAYAGSNNAAKALPVTLAAIGNVNIANAFGTNGLSGVMVNPSNGSLNDIVTGAITSTTTSSSLVNTMGNGFQVTILVTAASGTNPTLDVRIEESFDNGTNWVTLYDFQRITATGSYNSPMLRATGSHIRYVITVGGTSPSFTMSVNRNIRPLIPAEPQKRLIDRSIVLTTLDSVTPVLFQGAANNVQLIVSLGAATTPPAIQLEGSEDGINWYAIGAPLTGVANKTVQLTVNSLSATYTRARVTTVGAAVTMGYVAIKAWS